LSDERGQSTVELALGLPIVLVLVALVIETAALAVDNTRLWHAAREAARIAVVEGDKEQIQEAAARAAPTPFDLTVNPEPALRRQGDPLTVRLRHQPTGHVPILGVLFRQLELVATASMRIEQP
jgi:hypothetical protein